MVDLLILLLFVGSGGAAGWLGIHLLPEQLVRPDTDAEQLRLILTAAGGGTGLVAGIARQALPQFAPRRALDGQGVPPAKVTLHMTDPCGQ